MPVFTGTCSVHLVESCQHADRSSVPCWPAVSPGVRGDMPTDPRYRPAGRPGRTGRRQYADKSSVPASRQARTCGSAAICRQILGSSQRAGQDVRVGGNMRAPIGHQGRPCKHLPGAHRESLTTKPRVGPRYGQAERTIEVLTH